MTEDSPSRRPRRIAIGATVLVIAAAASFAGIYGIGALARNGDPVCRAALDRAAAAAPFARGEVAAVSVAKSGLKLPDLAFRDAEGRDRKLSQWQGRTVLVNLWATWCVPCRKEMPALDALQKQLGGADFEVVTINIDTRDTEKPHQWLKDNGIAGLAYYADPRAAVFQDLKAIGRAFGMPTTVLVDPAGCEIASLAGPAEWGGAEAVRLVTAALGR